MKKNGWWTNRESEKGYCRSARAPWRLAQAWITWVWSSPDSSISIFQSANRSKLKAQGAGRTVDVSNFVQAFLWNFVSREKRSWMLQDVHSEWGDTQGWRTASDTRTNNRQRCQDKLSLFEILLIFNNFSSKTEVCICFCSLFLTSTRCWLL